MCLPTQLSHKLQCDALGGLNILHEKQYLSFMLLPFNTISQERGGGRYPVPSSRTLLSVMGENT